MKKIIRCKCGKPAKRAFSAAISHSNKNGRGYGQINMLVGCCHNPTCLADVMSSCCAEIQSDETGRVKKSGRRTDATLVRLCYR
jgi:hypothetical protein